MISEDGEVIEMQGLMKQTGDCISRRAEGRRSDRVVSRIAPRLTPLSWEESLRNQEGLYDVPAAVIRAFIEKNSDLIQPAGHLCSQWAKCGLCVVKKEAFCSEAIPPADSTANVKGEWHFDLGELSIIYPTLDKKEFPRTWHFHPLQLCAYGRPSAYRRVFMPYPGPPSQDIILASFGCEISIWGCDVCKQDLAAYRLVDMQALPTACRDSCQTECQTVFEVFPYLSRENYSRFVCKSCFTARAAR